MAFEGRILRKASEAAVFEGRIWRKVSEAAVFEGRIWKKVSEAAAWGPFKFAPEEIGRCGEPVAGFSQRRPKINRKVRRSERRANAMTPSNK